jgi:hypothetical protein
VISVEFDLGSALKQVDALAKSANDAIRPAAQAGAQIFYEAVIAAAPKSDKGHWFHGTSFKAQTGRKFRDGSPKPDWAGGTKYWFEAGNLKQSIYQVYSKSDSTEEKAVYHVAWNHRKVPYGFMVAGGTKRGAKANDFVATARKSVADRAVAAMLAEFQQRVKV